MSFILYSSSNLKLPLWIVKMNSLNILNTKRASKTKRSVDSDLDNSDAKRRKGLDSSRIIDSAVASNSKGIKRPIEEGDNQLMPSAKKNKPNDYVTVQPSSDLPEIDIVFLKAFQLKSTYSKMELCEKTKLAYYLVTKMT